MSHKVPRLAKGLYRHNKSGELYEVIGVAKHSESGNFVVIYRPHSYLGEHEFFVRPFAMWNELVTVAGKQVPRFEPIDIPRSYVA